jgi:hypothetical protein
MICTGEHVKSPALDRENIRRSENVRVKDNAPDRHATRRQGAPAERSWLTLMAVDRCGMPITRRYAVLGIIIRSRIVQPTSPAALLVNGVHSGRVAVFAAVTCCPCYGRVTSVLAPGNNSG